MSSLGLCSVGIAIPQAGSAAQKRRISDDVDSECPDKRRKPEARRCLSKSQLENNIGSVKVTSPSPIMVEDDTLVPTHETTVLGLHTAPSGVPPISSNLRAALYDTLEFWKAHQGGIHSTKGVATGLLLNGKTTPRDTLQAEVIITTVGGGLKAGEDGKHIRTEDQSKKCTNYIVLNNAKEAGQPIGVVIGKQAVGKGQYANNLLSMKLDHQYNVLDWFFVTDIWQECQPTQTNGTSFAHFVVRLQRIKLGSVVWWVPKGDKRGGMHLVGDFNCRTTTCQSCSTASKEIFREGWCCLVATCTEFFHFSSRDINTDTLQYNDNFVNERVVWTSRHSPVDLVPGLPVLKEGQYGSEKEFKRGIMCPTCRFATRRISWEGWTCEKGCGFILKMNPKDVPMDLISKETDAVLRKHKTKFYKVDGRIQSAGHHVDGYEVTSFYLPNAPQNEDVRFIGSITVFRPTKSAIERSGGLNDLFNEIQEATRVGDVKLQRYPAFCRGSHMEELTSQFSCNMGADYKFGVVVETSKGFDSAPDPVMKALSRLTWGGATAVALTADHVAGGGLSVDSVSMPNEFIDFNEQLLLGYFERSQISFHDDGEKELGPTVATLSLGSPAVMHVRGKKKSGFGKETIGAGRVMLSFVMEHGDIVVMHGTRIHQHYEHAVSAAGIRRYGITCRYIRPELISDVKRREKAIANGRVPIHWQKQAYKGEPTEITEALSSGATHGQADEPE